MRSLLPGFSATLKANIGERHVNVAAVGCRTPLDPADRSAFADARLPKHLPFAVRIDRVDHGGFLPQQKRAPSVGKRNQRGRRGEIEIGTLRVGQFTLPGSWQELFQASFAVNCFDQRISPVERRNATSASLMGVGGSE